MATNKSLFRVYTILQEFVEARKYKVPTYLTEKEFMTEIQDHRYVKIDCDDVEILLAAVGSNIANKKERYMATTRATPKRVKRRILVAEKEASISIRDQSDEDGIILESYVYTMFKDNKLKTIHSPHHEIVDDPDPIIQDLESKGTPRTNIPHIYTTDAPVVWLNAKKGDLIRILRIGEDTGYSIAYRIVV